MPTISRRQAIAWALVAVALLTLAGALALDRSGPAAAGQPRALPLEQVAPAPTAPLPAVGAGAAAEEGPPLVVHVAGAVRKPGLYRLRPGSRVDDAIREAGGPRAGADLSLVNLAAPVGDGQQILVQQRASRGSPTVGEEAASTGSTTGAPVSLNSATLDQLDGLPGIGPVTAQRILDYRTEHGAFRSLDELDAVPGIGPARLEQLRDLVTL